MVAGMQQKRKKLSSPNPQAGLSMHWSPEWERVGPQSGRVGGRSGENGDSLNTLQYPAYF